MPRNDTEQLAYLMGLLEQARQRAPKQQANSMALWCCGEFEQAVGFYGQGGVA